MPPEASQAKSAETRKAGRPAEELAPYAFTKESARAAALKSHESRRRKREEMASGPREALALGLMDELQALRAGTRLLVQDYASAKAEVRKGARRELAIVLNQALGTIEQRKSGDGSTDEGQIPQDREGRTKLLAALEAYEAAGEE